MRADELAEIMRLPPDHPRRAKWVREYIAGGAQQGLGEAAWATINACLGAVELIGEPAGDLPKTCTVRVVDHATGRLRIELNRVTVPVFLRPSKGLTRDVNFYVTETGAGFRVSITAE